MNKSPYGVRLSNIKLLAESNKITLIDLAIKSKMSKNGLLGAIKRNNINADNLSNIANNLNAPISYFFLKPSDWEKTEQNEKIQRLTSEYEKISKENAELKEMIIQLTKKNILK